MSKKVIIAVISIMTGLGALYGFLLYLILISFGENFLFHCVMAGILFGFINSLVTLSFISKYSNMKLKNQILEQEIRIDKLTGLISRRAFDNDIKSFNTNVNYSMIYLDIDNLGDFNNKYGHQVGDKVLKICANKIKNCIRNSDFAYRYGGEEIVVILSGCKKKEAERIGLNIVKSIRSYDNSPYSRITISAGVASIPDDAITFEQLVEVSDLAMLKAKNQGKDQVVVHIEI